MCALRALVGQLGIAIFLVGCGPPMRTSVETTADIDPETHERASGFDSRESVAQATSRGDWQLAWKLSRQELTREPDSVPALLRAARIASELNLRVEACQLAEEAARADGYADETVVQQCVQRLLVFGRPIAAVAVLDRAVQQDETRATMRRTLTDLLVELERRDEASLHFRELIRQRKFDLSLLMSCTSDDFRTHESKTLERIVSLYPDDARPLIGKARRAFDRKKYGETLEVLSQILDQRPDDPPARLLWGRTMARRGDRKAMVDWFTDAPTHWKSLPDYWMVRGTWFQLNDQPNEAIHAFQQAYLVGPNRSEVVQKLRASIFDATTEASEVESASDSSPQDSERSREQIVAVLSHRAAALGEIQRRIALLRAESSDNPRATTEIAGALLSIGRYWEAEAWAAIALTLDPQDDLATRIRQQSVAQLKQDRTWGQIEPSIARWIKASVRSRRMPEGAFGDSLIAWEPDGNAPSSRSGGEHPATKIRFENEARSRGLVFRAQPAPDMKEPGNEVYEMTGCGAAAIDFDRDGQMDLFFSTGGGNALMRDSSPSTLFRNTGGQFRDVGELARSLDPGYGQGVAVGDLNEDGFSDILCLNIGANQLLLNNGDGTFENVTDDHPIGRDLHWSTCGVLADVDRDGLSDVVVVNYCGGTSFLTRRCPGEHGREYRACRPTLFPARSDQLFSGGANGTLVDRTAEWLVPADSPGRGLGVIAGRLTQREHIELFVANDMSENHHWVRRDGSNPQWVEAASVTGLATDGLSASQGSMGITVADIDHDQDLDLLVTNFDDEYNTLYQQKSEGFWADCTEASNLHQDVLDSVGFGCLFRDADHDGDHELFVTNGHVDDYGGGILYAQQAQAFAIAADGNWERLPTEVLGDYGAQRHVGRAMLAVDVNGDAREDLVITDQAEAVALLVNRTSNSNHHVAIELVGVQSSRIPIGAILKISFGDQQRTVPLVAGEGYFSSQPSVLIVGVGQADTIRAIEIQWPSGKTDRLEGLACDRHYLMVEGQGDAYALKADRRTGS